MAFKMKSPLKNYSKPLKMNFLGGILGGGIGGNLVNKVSGLFGRNRNRGNAGSARSGARSFAEKAATGALGSLFTKKGKIKK